MESEQDNLSYARARYYDSESCGFLTKDPLGITAGLNNYLYVNANPINNIDPTGLITAVVVGFGSADGGANGDFVDSFKGVSDLVVYGRAQADQAVQDIIKASQNGERVNIAGYSLGDQQQ